MKKILVILLACLLLCYGFCMVGCDKENPNDDSRVSFTVKFDGNGGTLVSGKETQKVSSASEIVPPVYEKAGFEFDKWNKDLTTIKSDETVKAVWKEASYYNVTIDVSEIVNISENWKQNKTVKVNKGEKLGEELPDPVIYDEHYGMDYWYYVVNEVEYKITSSTIFIEGKGTNLEILVDKGGTKTPGSNVGAYLAENVSQTFIIKPKLIRYAGPY